MVWPRWPRDKAASNRAIADEVMARSRAQSAYQSDPDEVLDMHGRPTTLRALGVPERQSASQWAAHSLASTGGRIVASLGASARGKRFLPKVPASKRALTPDPASLLTTVAVDKNLSTRDEVAKTGRFSALDTCRSEAWRAEAAGRAAAGTAEAACDASWSLREKRGPRTPEECYSPTFGSPKADVKRATVVVKAGAGAASGVAASRGRSTGVGTEGDAGPADSGLLRHGMYAHTHTQTHTHTHTHRHTHKHTHTHV